MRISIREVYDYIRCPLYYKLKNIDEIPVDKTIEDYFREYFKLALYFYYFSLMEKKPKSFEGMIKRWEELWFSRTMIELFPEADLKEKSNEAITIMSSFMKKWGMEKVTPIAVNFQYEAMFEGQENLVVTGDIDLIKIVNDRTNKSETCISMFVMSKVSSDSFMIKNDLGTSIASYAFRSNFKAREDKIIMKNIRRSDEVPTLRTGGDYARAEKSIRNMCRGIKAGIFYPAPNIINCGICPYRMFCLNDKSINTGGETHGGN